MSKSIVLFFVIFFSILLAITIYTLILNIISVVKENRERKKILESPIVYIIRENNSWEEISLDPPNNTIECVEAIIDDALCHGFEFKVDNGKIYFRERLDK